MSVMTVILKVATTDTHGHVKGWPLNVPCGETILECDVWRSPSSQYDPGHRRSALQRSCSAGMPTARQCVVRFTEYKIALAGSAAV